MRISRKWPEQRGCICRKRDLVNKIERTNIGNKYRQVPETISIRLHGKPPPRNTNLLHVICLSGADI